MNTDEEVESEKEESKIEFHDWYKSIGETYFDETNAMN